MLSADHGLSFIYIFINYVKGTMGVTTTQLITEAIVLDHIHQAIDEYARDIGFVNGRLYDTGSADERSVSTQ